MMNDTKNAKKKGLEFDYLFITRRNNFLKIISHNH